MNWIYVDNQDELNKLNTLNDWNEGTTIEFYSKPSNEIYFPDDVSRSGWTHNNIHLINNAYSSQFTHIEIVLISCDRCDSGYLNEPHFNGKVDGLRRVEIYNIHGELRMRCARLIYRTLNIEPHLPRNYFKTSNSVKGLDN